MNVFFIERIPNAGWSVHREDDGHVIGRILRQDRRRGCRFKVDVRNCHCHRATLGKAMRVAKAFADRPRSH